MFNSKNENTRSPAHCFIYVGRVYMQLSRFYSLFESERCKKKYSPVYTHSLRLILISYPIHVSLFEYE